MSGAPYLGGRILFLYSLVKSEGDGGDARRLRRCSKDKLVKRNRSPDAYSGFVMDAYDWLE